MRHNARMRSRISAGATTTARRGITTSVCGNTHTLPDDMPKYTRCAGVDNVDKLKYFTSDTITAELLFGVLKYLHKSTRRKHVGKHVENIEKIGKPSACKYTAKLHEMVTNY